MQKGEIITLVGKLNSVGNVLNFIGINQVLRKILQETFWRVSR